MPLAPNSYRMTLYRTRVLGKLRRDVHGFLGAFDKAVRRKPPWLRRTRALFRLNGGRQRWSVAETVQ